MNVHNNPTTREVQMAILDIFKIVSKILEENGLRYFAIGGTCIGAVRHHGFIPWDDDIDIAMPNQDYNMFLKIADTVLPNNLKVCTPTNTKNYNNLTIRVHNTNTTFIERHIKDMPGRYMGVFLDIMPLYGVPDGEKAQKKYMSKIRRYKKLNHKKKMPFSTCQTLNSKALYFASLPINIFLPEDYWYKKWVKLLSNYNFDDCNYTGYVWWDSDRLIFPHKEFSDYVYFPFEDTRIRVPIGYDGFLRKMFGDYMKLPPESQRENHSNGDCIIDLERSYTYYIDKLRK